VAFLGLALALFHEADHLNDPGGRFDGSKTAQVHLVHELTP